MTKIAFAKHNISDVVLLVEGVKNGGSGVTIQDVLTLQHFNNHFV